MSGERERFARARELFTAALAHEGVERDRFLAEACRDDAQLLDDVLALLAQHSLDGQHFEPQAWREPPLTPERVGPYRVLGTIGEGGMGVVYRARREGDDAPDVALKVLRPGALGPQFERRLRREAEVLGRLDHPGIARLLDAGSADGAPYLAMEFVAGVSLARWRVERDPSVADRLRLLAELAEAVDAAHERGVIHRDLKPENILVTPDGHPHVLDFGIARLADTELPAQTLMTQTWQLLGTIRYMSPEQAAGSAADVDARTDIYSLGVIAFELLTGQLPYDLTRLSTPRALLEITTAEPRRLAGLLPSRSGDLESVLLHALAKQPADRYPTAAALAADLRRVRDGKRATLRRPGPGARLARHWRTRPRLRRLAVWLALAATALALTFVLTMPGRLRPAVTWNQLYTELEEADRLRHRNNATRADLLAAAGLFQRARTDLAQLPAMPYTSDLHRYIKWRLGEIHYFIGGREHDLGELELARGYWQDARVMIWNRGTALGLDTLAVVRPRVLRLGRHHPSAGVGYTRLSMAGLQSPATNLREAVLALGAARSECGEGPTDYQSSLVYKVEGADDLTAVMLDFGGAACAQGAVLDSVPLVRDGLDALREAARRGTIRSTDGRASLLRGLGTAFLELGTRCADPAALDSAAACLDQARDLCDPSLGRGYWRLHRTRGDVAQAQAAAARDPQERLAAWRRAREDYLTSLAPLRAGEDDLERAGSAGDLAAVEASLALELPAPARLTVADSLLTVAERLLGPDHPAVPWAEFQWRRARVALARWHASGDEDARAAALAAVARARATLPRLEYPSLYRRLEAVERDARAARGRG